MQLMLAQPKIDVDSPVVPLVAFDPPIIKPGETSTYRVTLNALETAVEWPESIPAPPQLTPRAGARGQILSMSGALLVPRTTFNYRVRPTESGQYTVPEYKVTVNGKAISIPAATLEVATMVPAGVAATQRLLLDVPTNGLYVGQPIRARVILPGAPGGVVQSLGQVQLNGQGFVVDQSSAHARIEAMPIGATRRTVSSFVYELMLTPIATGKLSLFAQGYAVGNRVIGGVILSAPGGTLPQYTLVDSDPVALEIRPLPRGGRLAGFTGAVGNYSVDPPELSTNIVAVGDALRLKLKIRGEGNLARLVPPPAPRTADWQIFAVPSENTPAQIIQAQGFVTFNYTLIPLTDHARATPAIPFSSFNPDRGAYEDLSVPPVEVKVLPGTATAADLETLRKADRAESETEQEPVLSGLAVTPGLAGALVPVQRRFWFPLIHLIPAGGLLGLCLWDRRRRFLEQHPDIILRRRALRALRRERRTLERAAQKGDSAEFGASAVNAMKLAVAPYYPAEPRALVGADVLMILPEEERLGEAGQTVRNLFLQADAAQFGTRGATLTNLLALRPGIEGVLNRLENRLCE